MATARVTANDWLPCAEECRAEAARHLPVILQGILDGAGSGDWHHLMRKSVHGLKRYLDLKYAVPVADRAAVAVVMYRVVTEEPSLDQQLQKLFTQQLIRLLKPRPHDGGRLQITLAWQPLLRTIEMLFFGKARIPQTPLCAYLGYYYVMLARVARHYFAEGADADIMKEIRPFLCAQHSASLFKGQVLLTLMLPRGPESGLSIVGEIISIWGWVVSYADWDLHWIVFLASLCRHTYRTCGTQWDSAMPELFAHVLHIIDLPVGASKVHIYGNMENSVASADGFPFFSLASFVHLTDSRSKALQMVHKSAKLLVYLLRPATAQGGGHGLSMLARVLNAVESYLHPSNGGYWTRRLSQLLASLCEYFTERVSAERLLPASNPSRLTEADVDKFAELILPLAMQGLYSKSGTATLQSCVALKYLGTLAPSIALPPLLVRVYQALTTLIEVHQTSSALEAMAAVICPVIRPGKFHAGVGHVSGLMELTLTGIDANDLPKTWATLRFYTVLLCGMPLIRLPETCPEGVEQEKHEVARLATDGFADWAFRLLDQTFAFVVNQNSMPPQQGEVKSKADSETRTSEYFFHCTLEVFFMQLGDDLYASALNKVATFCFTNLLLQQQQPQLGVIVSAMTAVQPAMTVHKFIPTCLSILLVSPTDYATTPRTPRTPTPRRTTSVGSACKGVSPKLQANLSPNGAPLPGCAASGAPTECEAGTSGGYKLALLSEMELVYYLNLMRYVVDNAGDFVLPYKDKVMAVVDLALQVEEKPGIISLQVFKSANKLVRALMHSLVTCRPKEHRSVPPARWCDASWQKRHYEWWGSVTDMASVHVSWHTPSPAGLQWAADLGARYVRKPLVLLERYATAMASAAAPTASKAAVMPGVNGAANVAAGADGMGGLAEGPVGTAGDDGMVVDLDSQVTGHGTDEVGSKVEARESARKRPMDLEISVPSPNAGSPTALQRAQAVRRKVAGSTATEARLAVLQVRYVLEGLVAAMPLSDADGDAAVSTEGWGDEAMAAGGVDDDDQGIGSTDGMPGAEEYCSGTYELPVPNVDTSHALNLGTSEDGAALRPAYISAVILRLLRVVQTAHSQDSKMLKALAKCVDVSVNGVDILQKHARKLRLRYTIMKARNREIAGDGHTKLLPRYMLIVKLHHHYLTRVMLRGRKARATPLSTCIMRQVNSLAVNEHSDVRGRGQLALLSICRRYSGACAVVLPRLIEILADKKVEAAGHEQRINGACALLQTRYFQSRIIRDWRMIEFFLITLCSSYHNDKDTVLDALDDLFATFLSFWYQVTLQTPGYAAWRGGRSQWPRADEAFGGYGQMLEALVKLLKTAPHMHWRFQLMVIDAVTVMIRDDVESPPAVWECILDGLVSDNSHMREACVPALGSALEMMQPRQQSKEDETGAYARFPDKAFMHWNGAPPARFQNEAVFAARKRVVTPEYSAAVREVMMRYMDDEAYVGKLTAVMSVLQLGRAKMMNGSHAQMWKGMVKAYGPGIVARLTPTMLSWCEGDAATKARESSDVYLGQQCFAAELVAGLVRGSKYWSAEDQASMRSTVSTVLTHMLSVAEMESVGIWAACLRFCLYDRHPRHSSWLIELMLDDAIPSNGEMGATSVLMRSCVGGIIATLARVSWDPAVHHGQQSLSALPVAAPAGEAAKRAGGQESLGQDRGGAQPRLVVTPQFAGRATSSAGVHASETVIRLVAKSIQQWACLTARHAKEKVASAPAGKDEADVDSAMAAVTAAAADMEVDSADAAVARDDESTPQGADGSGVGKAEGARVKDELRHLRHMLIVCVSSACPTDYDGMFRCPLESFLPVVLPPLLAALEDRDVDISRQAKGCVELAANTPLLPSVLPRVLEAVRSVSTSQSWQVRSSVLPFLQIMIFRHQCAISVEDMAAVRLLMLSLLQDPQVEVREMASAAVAVLVRICGEELALSLKDDFCVWAGQKLPSDKGTDAFKGAIKRRHAGVLGMAALIGAYPYHVPAWMPEILLQLAQHVLDPIPIKPTVRNTFGEFWRTHQDTWPILKEKFTDDQLSGLTDLLASPTYFS